MYNPPHISDVLAPQQREAMQEDAYPIALESVAVILISAKEAASISQSEADILSGVLDAAQAVIRRKDRGSMHLIGADA